MSKPKMEAPGAGTPGSFNGHRKTNNSNRITHQRARSNNNSPSTDSLLDLVPELKRVSSSGGGEYAGPCPFCGGTDRFRCWPTKGRAWCRQCGWKGDAIQLLRDRDGLSFFEARRQLGLSTDRPSREAIRKQKARRIALQAAQDSFCDWSRRKLIALTDEYREELSAELEVTETAMRQIRRCPDLYTLDEKMEWAGKLYAIRERQEALEHQLDLLTYDRNELGCVRWWKEETQGGEHAPGRAA